MNAIKYLRNRFEFAAKGSGNIRINQNDIDAINKLIEFENAQKRNTELEDSLLLFYLLGAWKIENHNNKVFLTEKEDNERVFPMTITNADAVLNRISSFINPKKEMIRMLADELWVHQVYNRIPKENQVKYDDVEKMMNEVLILAKEKFPMIRALSKEYLNFIRLKPLSKDD